MLACNQRKQLLEALIKDKFEATYAFIWSLKFPFFENIFEVLAIRKSAPVFHLKKVIFTVNYSVSLIAALLQLNSLDFTTLLIHVGNRLTPNQLQQSACVFYPIRGNFKQFRYYESTVVSYCYLLLLLTQLTTRHMSVKNKSQARKTGKMTMQNIRVKNESSGQGDCSSYIRNK